MLSPLRLLYPLLLHVLPASLALSSPPTPHSAAARSSALRVETYGAFLSSDAQVTCPGVPFAIYGGHPPFSVYAIRANSYLNESSTKEVVVFDELGTLPQGTFDWHIKNLAVGANASIFVIDRKGNTAISKPTLIKDTDWGVCDAVGPSVGLIIGNVIILSSIILCLGFIFTLIASFQADKTPEPPHGAVRKRETKEMLAQSLLSEYSVDMRVLLSPVSDEDLVRGGRGTAELLQMGEGSELPGYEEKETRA
ncbi:hypothetical protein MNV49_001332 [Pseudohyphozyma bogoriensis]|nr:hypothetical protein MNV49_001332 [Pseudohyphozyma bogoriensis]